MSRENELLASEQMRDRIADFLDQQGDERDRRTPRQRAAGKIACPRSKLLWGMAQEVRRMPGRLAQLIGGNQNAGK